MKAKWMLLLTGLLILALGLGAGLYRAFAQPPTPSPLAAYVLPAEAFPHSQRLAEGPLSPQDLSQPLNPNNLAPMGIGEEPLRFQEGYGRTLALWDAASATLVSHFLYRYPNPDQARRIAEALARGWQMVPQPAETQPVEGGWWLSTRDSEGGFLQVLLQTRGEILSLLIVNGDGEARVRAAMDRATQALPIPPER